MPVRRIFCDYILLSLAKSRVVFTVSLMQTLKSFTIFFLSKTKQTTYF
jgi:hypothetical protein